MGALDSLLGAANASNVTQEMYTSFVGTYEDLGEILYGDRIMESANRLLRLVGNFIKMESYTPVGSPSKRISYAFCPGWMDIVRASNLWREDSKSPYKYNLALDLLERIDYDSLQIPEMGEIAIAARYLTNKHVISVLRRYADKRCKRSDIYSDMQEWHEMIFKGNISRELLYNFAYEVRREIGEGGLNGRKGKEIYNVLTLLMNGDIDKVRQLRGDRWPHPGYGDWFDGLCDTSHTDDYYEYFETLLMDENLEYLSRPTDYVVRLPGFAESNPKELHVDASDDTITDVVINLICSDSKMNDEIVRKNLICFVDQEMASESERNGGTVGYVTRWIHVMNSSTGENISYALEVTLEEYRFGYQY